MDSPLSRRKVLQVSGVGSVLAIAGCAESGLDAAQPDDEDPGSDTEGRPNDEEYINVKDVYASKGGGFLYFTVENNSERTLEHLSLDSRDANVYGISVYDIPPDSSIEFTHTISYDVSGGEKDVKIYRPLFEGDIESFTSKDWDLNASVSDYSSLYDDVELTFPLPDGISSSDAKSVSIFENILGEESGSEVHKGAGDNITWTVNKFYTISEYDLEVETLEGTQEYTVGPPNVQTDFDLVDVAASETDTGMKIDSVTIDLKSDKLYNGGLVLTREKRSSAELGSDTGIYSPTRAVEPLKEPVQGEHTIDISEGAHFSAPLEDGQKLRVHLLEGPIPFSSTTSDEVLSYL